jgi:hypothetical protein
VALNVLVAGSYRSAEATAVAEDPTPPATSTCPFSNKLAVGIERGDDIMPVAVNVPVVLVDVDELDPLSPQETRPAPIQASKPIEKIFFISKSHFI